MESIKWNNEHKYYLDNQAIFKEMQALFTAVFVQRAKGGAYPVIDRVCEQVRTYLRNLE